MKYKRKPARFSGQVSPLFCIIDLMPGLPLEQKGEKFDEMCCLLNVFFEKNNFPVTLWRDFETVPETRAPFDTYIRFFYGIQIEHDQ